MPGLLICEMGLQVPVGRTPLPQVPIHPENPSVPARGQNQTCTRPHNISGPGLSARSWHPFSFRLIGSCKPELAPACPKHQLLGPSERPDFCGVDLLIHAVDTLVALALLSGGHGLQRGSEWMSTQRG